MDQLHSNTIQPIRQKGKHFTEADRGSIEALKREGYSNRQIAKRLNCSPSSIANELKRGTLQAKTGGSKHDGRGRKSIYLARRGHAQYLRNRKACRRGYMVKMDYLQPFLDWVVDRVTKAKWSFETCLGYARRHELFSGLKLPTVKTLYNAVWRKDSFINRFHLPVLLKRRKSKGSVRPNRRIKGTSIDMRPDIINDRKEFGHWEIDTMLSHRQRGHVLCTLVERLTRFSIAIKIPAKTCTAVDWAISELRDKYQERFGSIFKSITADNGSEFDRLSQYEYLGTKVYFTHPYSSWERGQNERINRDLRGYFPKRVNLSNVTPDEIEEALLDLNARPRKVLEYRTPEELFEAELDRIYAI